MALTPDAIPHLSSPLTAPDPTADAGLAEGLAALESYKKKDPAKGSCIHPSIPPSARLLSVTPPDRELTKRPSRYPPSTRAVVVRFKAVGNAPIMKQNFFRVTVSNHFQAVIQFLRKELGWKAGEPLVSTMAPVCVVYLRFSTQFTYINLAFSPAPDDTIANLYRVSPIAYSFPHAETDRQNSRSRRMGIS